jgi:hypothetical protein
MSKTRYVEREIAKSVALSTPAVRTVIVRVYGYEEEPGELKFGVEFFPVVAIRAVVQDGYAKEVPEGTSPRSGQDHREMKSLGWDFTGQYVATELMIVSAEGYLAEADDDRSANADDHVVACVWEPAEDAERFAPIVEDLKSGFRENPHRVFKSWEKESLPV